MSKLFQAELYRLKVQKSTRIFFIIFAVLSFFFTFINGFLYGNAPWIDDMLEAMRMGNEDDFVTMNELRILVQTSLGGIHDYGTYIAKTALVQAPVFIAVLVAAYIIQPFRSGYIKNYAGAFEAKEIILTGSLMLLIISAAATVLNTVISTTLFFLFFRNTPFGDPIALLIFLLLKILLLWTAGLIFTLVSLFFKRMIAGVILSIIYSAVFAANFYTIADTIFINMLEKKYSPSFFTPIGNYMTMMPGDMKRALIALIVTAVWASAAILLSIFALKRKDIN